MPPAATAQGPSQRIVITAAKMIDATTGKVTEFPAIFVEGGRITSIADARTVRWGEDVKHIDLSGKTLLPGLIDMHVHLESSPTYGDYDSLQFTDRFWTVIGVGNARAMLDAGFTTVRNVGSEGYNDVALKQAIAEGWAVGPRIVPAAHALGATGGHCDQTYLPPLVRGQIGCGRRWRGRIWHDAARCDPRRNDQCSASFGQEAGRGDDCGGPLC